MIAAHEHDETRDAFGSLLLALAIDTALDVTDANTARALAAYCHPSLSSIARRAYFATLVEQCRELAAVVRSPHGTAAAANDASARVVLTLAVLTGGLTVEPVAA